MDELSPDELKELQTAECTCAALTYWKGKVQTLCKALSRIPHTCQNHLHLECAGCMAQAAIQGVAEVGTRNQTPG